MARRRPLDRFGQLVSAAAEVFIAQGYQRTQVQDVADVLGVAKGTVYGCVESKAALLGAAVRFADGIEAIPAPHELPLRTPAEGELAALVAGRLRGVAGELKLVAALSSHPDHADHGRVPVAEELMEIIEDLYRHLARHRMSIKLVDRCAPELPDLAEVWFGLGRAGQVAALTEYLRRRTSSDALHLPGPASLVARTILETCVLWAVHLHWDPAADRDAHARPDVDTVVGTLAGLLTHGLLTRPPSR